MAILDRLFRRESGSSSLSGGKSGSSSGDNSNRPSAAGQDISGNIIYANGEYSSLSVAAFFRAVSLRGDTMARLIMQYQKRINNTHYVEDHSPYRGHRLNYMLQLEPNPMLNATALWRKLDFLSLLRGNAYIYVERGLDDEIRAFWLCSSATYIPGEDTYSITYYVGTQPYTIAAVPAKNILHFRNTITRSDGFTGMSLLQFAAGTLNLAATEDNLALDTMAKGGRKKLILQEQAQQNMGLGKVKREAMEDIRRNTQNDLPGNDVLYVPNVADIKDFSQSLTELELSTLKKLSVADVARFTSVPKSLLMDDSNSTYRTPDAAMLDFLNSCIAPKIEEMEDEFNRKLLGMEGWGSHRYHLCPNNLFRLDRKTQGEWNKNRLETGVVSINELRAEQELAPIGPEGDEHYVSANLIKAGSPKLSGENPNQEPPANNEPPAGNEPTDTKKKKGGKQ